MRSASPAGPIGRPTAGVSPTSHGRDAWAIAIAGWQSPIRDDNGPVRHIALERAFRQIYRLRWSPDARLLLANGTDSDGRFGVYTIAVATGKVRAVENGDRVWGRDPFPQWSSDGRAVLFHAREPNGAGRALFARDLTTGRERRVDDLASSLLAGRRRLEPQKLDLDMPGIREVRVHADGSRVAFFVERTAAELWVMENFLPRTIARR